MYSLKLFFAIFLLIILVFGCSTNTFKILVANSNPGYTTLRYNEETGDTWEYIDGIWFHIIDEKKLPRSEYEVKLSMSNDGGWVAVRIDVKSGKSWIIDGNKWTKIRE